MIPPPERPEGEDAVHFITEGAAGAWLRAIRDRQRTRERNGRATGRDRQDDDRRQAIGEELSRQIEAETRPVTEREEIQEGTVRVDATGRVVGVAFKRSSER